MEQEPGVAAGGSDAELITRVRAGDRGAYGTLYARHSQAATNLARQFARSPAEVDDLVSESFARVLDALLGGRGPATAFRAYLFTTLRNTAFDRSRKDSRLQFTDDVTVHETPEVADDPVVLELENTLVAKAFGALPERWQVVLWHTQVERQSPAEVGVLLGMSANAVTSLAFRAREGLREEYLRAHLADTAAERCRSTVDRLGAWVRGGLSKREQAQVDAHLNECDRCRALAAELTEINSGLRGLLAPLLLGGAAAGYLATTSSTVLPLAAAGAAGGAAAAGAGATAGSGSSGGVLSFLARPWTLAAGGAGVAAAAVVAVVIAVSGGGQQPEQADAAARVTPPATTGAVLTTSASTASSAPAPSSTEPSTSEVASVAPPPPSTSSISTTSSATTSDSASSAPAPTTARQPPVILSTVGQRPGTPSTEPPATPTSSTGARSSSSPSPTSTSPSTSAPPTSSPTPATLSEPQFASGSLDARAGASATATFSVVNSGDTDSDPQSAQVLLPDGVSLDGATGTVAPQAQALRRFSALLAPGAVPATDAVTCHGSTCRYTVPANSTLTVTLRLTVDPDAVDGKVTLRVSGSTVSLKVTVQPGLTDLRLSDPTGSGGWQAGSTVTSTLQADVAAGVTDAGTVTLPVHNESLWITGYPDNCQPSGEAAITCAPVSVHGHVADFGEFSVTVLPDADGKQRVTTTLPGDRTLPVTAADGTAVRVTPLEPGGPIAMTGPFDGAIVATPTMACGDDDRRTDWDCDMTAIDGGSPTITVPGGPSDTIVWAGLLWAAGSVQQGHDLASVVLGPAGSTCDPDAHKCASQRVVAQTGNDHAANPAQVQHWFGIVDKSKIYPGQALTIKDFPASTDSHGALPMGGWALAVVWSSKAGATSTVSFTRPAAGAFANNESHSTTVLAPRGAIRADILLWGTDAIGHKTLAFGTEEIDYHSYGRGHNEAGGPLSGTSGAGRAVGMDSFSVTSQHPANSVTITQKHHGPDLLHTGDTFLWAAVLMVG